MIPEYSLIYHSLSLSRARAHTRAASLLYLFLFVEKGKTKTEMLYFRPKKMAMFFFRVTDSCYPPRLRSNNPLSFSLSRVEKGKTLTCRL